jgi:hypothetical protein
MSSRDPWEGHDFDDVFSEKNAAMQDFEDLVIAALQKACFVVVLVSRRFYL